MSDKLPDVVWVRTSKFHEAELCEHDAFGSPQPYVSKSALDAMTAEKESLRESRHRLQIAFTEKSAALDAMTAERDQLKKANDQLFAHGESMFKERDSAREALATAIKLLRKADEIDALRDQDETLAAEARAFLAAQPETKP